MGDSRDLDQKLSSSFEIEDNNGIELSLGLACGRFASKAKCNISVKDHDENKETEENGKACLGNITLKDFCQRSLGDKENNGKQHSGSLPQQKEIFWTSLQTNTSKEPEKFTRTRINEVQFPGFGEPWHAAETSKHPNGSPQQILSNVAEKNTQAESSGAPPNKNNTDTILNDLQFSLHVAAGGGEFAQSNFPAHFLGTLGNGSAITGHPIVQSCASASVTQNPIQLVGTQSSSPGLKPSLQLDTTQGKQFIGMENLETDQQQRQSGAQQHWQDDTLEQQKIREVSAQKWQEARKKRKLLIEEQKLQKKAKRDDERAGSHAFRRPGSNTWVRGWEPPAPSIAEVVSSRITQCTHEGDIRASEICYAFQQARDRNTKDNELETDEESSESQQESNISDNCPSPSAKVDEVGKSSSIAKEEGNSPKRGIKNLIEAQQCMTVQTDGSQRREETEEQECKMITVGLDKPLVQLPTVGNNSNSALANTPTTTSITMTNTTLPYSVPSFPVMPAPYSLPTPVPNHPNVPFPGYPFVYLMQYPPPAVDVTNCTAARPPIYPNGYQLPLGYAPFQLPMTEGSPSWVPVLRPQQSPLAPNFGGPRTSLEPKEDKTKVSQG